MNGDTETVPEDPSPVDQIIADYLRAEEAGRAPDRARFLAEHKQHEEELRAFFAHHDDLKRRVEPLLVDSVHAQPTTEPFEGARPPSSGEGPSFVGRTVGDYLIVEVLGWGGMGVVYKAHQVSLNRVVALKMIRHAEHAPESARLRFRQEAMAIARLPHKYIVEIYDWGELDGLPFFALEFCPGGTLADELQGPPPSPADAARLVEDLARAIHVAHTLDPPIIHRDLKPANVLLTADGTPKITDFGLAKMLSEGAETAPDAIMGTASYMAPEQASGHAREAGPPADVWALGAMLYEMLTGTPPFRGKNKLEILHKVQHVDPTPVRRLQPRVPRDLEAICLKCLEKEPKKRYDTAEDLADDLRRFQEGRPVKGHPVGRVGRTMRWAKRHPSRATALALFGVVLLTAFYIVFSWMLAREQKRAQARFCLEHGQSLCERGEIGRGMLWMVRGLEIAPTGEADLRQQLRTRLAGWNSRLHPLQAVFDHPGAVWAVALSTDGKIVATGGVDQTGYPVHLWAVDPEAKPPIDKLPHDRPVSALAFHPDPGRHLLATGCWDYKARLWDLETGKARHSLGHGGPVRALAFSPDGKWLLTGSEDGTACLWDVDRGTRIGDEWKHDDEVWAVAFDSHGRRALTAGRAGKIRLWELSPEGQANEVLTLEHTAPVTAVAFAPENKQPGQGRALAGSLDGTAVVWDLDERRPLGPPLHHPAEVWSVAWNAEHDLIVTGCADGSARLWEGDTRSPVGASLRHGDTVWSAVFSADGSHVLTGGADKSARLWQVSQDESRFALRHPAPVTCLAFDPSGDTLAVGCSDGKIHRRRVETGEKVGDALEHGKGARLTAVLFHPEGKLLFSCGDKGVARAWEWASGQPVGQPMRHDSEILAAALSPDGQFLATASRDKTARLWEAATGKPHGEPLPHDDRVTALAFSPDGKLLLTGCADGKARLWDTQTGQAHGEPFNHGAWIHAVAFSPQGNAVATGGIDDTAAQWQIDGGPLGGRLHHRGAVYTLAYSPDGQVLATGSGDWTVNLWRAGTSERIGTPGQHQGPVRLLAFNSVAEGTGRLLLASGGAEPDVRVWDARTGKPAAAPLPHHGALRAVRFSPGDKTRLATGSGDGLVQLWQIPPPLGGPADEIALRVRADTGMALSGDGMPQILSAEEWGQYRARLREMEDN